MKEIIIHILAGALLAVACFALWLLWIQQHQERYETLVKHSQAGDLGTIPALIFEGWEWPAAEGEKK